MQIALQTGGASSKPQTIGLLAKIYVILRLANMPLPGASIPAQRQYFFALFQVVIMEKGVLYHQETLSG